MWTQAPHNISLLPGVVHLWKIELEKPPEPLAYYESMISKEEAARAARFYFERDQRQFIVGRASLRQLLGRYLKRPPRSLAFTFSQFGKPDLADYPDLKFNVSHSGGLALMAFVQQAEIGVDLEEIRSDLEFERIASRFFAPQEKKSLLQLPIQQQAMAFHQCWTSKEAFIKAHGQGLSLPLDQFEVEVHPDKPAALKAVHWAPQLVEEWDLYGFTPAENFRGAVVCDRKIRELFFYHP